MFLINEGSVMVMRLFKARQGKARQDKAYTMS
jgi:hypothetical protein